MKIKYIFKTNPTNYPCDVPHLRRKAEIQSAVRQEKGMMDKKQYADYVKKHAPSSPLLKDLLRAFWVGGAICAVGEGLLLLFSHLGMETKDAAATATVCLVFCSALLTGLGVFDYVGKYAGAGTLVPVTGFANAVVSPAIDCKSEGLVLGVGAKIFTVAGPVLLFGTLSGVLWGLIYWLLGLFGIM